MPWRLRLASLLLVLTVFFSRTQENSKQDCWNAASLKEFKLHCHASESNRAFQNYAEVPDNNPKVAATENVACFPNRREKEKDWLCIFRDFGKGRTSIDDMALGDLESQLHTLFADGWLLRSQKQGIELDGAPEHICFHKKGAGSVQWTHAHMFREEPAPDNMQLDGSDVYCVSVTNYMDPRAAATKAARDMSQKVRHGRS